MRRIIFPQGKRDRKSTAKLEKDPGGQAPSQTLHTAVRSPLLPPLCFKLRVCGWNYFFFSHAKSRDGQLIDIRTLGRTSGLLSWPSRVPTNCTVARALSGIFIAAFKFTRLSIKRGNGAPFTAARGDCPNIL